MLVDVLEGSRIVYAPLREINIGELPEMKVTDHKPNSVYVNARIAEGSALGEGCFLIACFVGEGAQIRDHAKIFGSRVGNGVSIGQYSSVEQTSFGNNVHLGYSASVGHDCSFGNGVQISTGSHFAAETRFGDDAMIGHWNTFRDNCRFGKGAVIGSGNLFYGFPKFADAPKFDKFTCPSERRNNSLQIYQEPAAYLLGNEGRTVITLEEYLKREDLWRKS